MINEFKIIPFIIILTLFSCKERNKQEQTQKTVDTEVKFTEQSFDFGEISEGEIVTHSFYFKNIGSHHFVIKNMESSCGCTTAEQKKEPVKEGEEGKIEIAFNSSGRYGKQYKEISIFANVPEKVIVLKIVANVRQKN